MARRHVFAVVLILCAVLSYFFFWERRSKQEETSILQLTTNNQQLTTLQPPRPNVILIVLDACRADRIGAVRNGLPVTPTLTRLAKTSLDFSRAITPCTWTKPAMASIFTSLYVDAHQVYYSVDPAIPDSPTSDALPSALESMASYLKKSGYSTAGIQTNGNLVEELGFKQGFDTYFFQSDADADWVTSLAIEEIEKLTPPFFLYAHYMDPHAPYDPPEPYRSMFGPLPTLPPAEQDAVAHSIEYLVDQAYHFLGIRETRRYAELSPEGRETLLALYDAECRFMDTEVAKLVEFICTERENTLVIVLADHGEEFWEHGSMGHGQTMYQEQLAVPFFIHGPGINPQTSHSLIETLHVLPTVAAYLGLKPNPDWQGYDLLAQLDSEQDGPVFSNTYASFPRSNVQTEMVLVGDTKLIIKHASDEIELYNLAEDPDETDNIAEQHRDTVRRMHALLDKHRKANLRYCAGKGMPEPVGLPPLILEQLGALGYLGNGEGARNQVELDEQAQERLKGLGYLD